MDYKDILEGTRPFFQGLPLPSPQVNSNASANLNTPTSASPPVTPATNHNQNHHLLNHFNNNSIKDYHSVISSNYSGKGQQGQGQPLHRSGSVSSLQSNSNSLPLALPQDGEALIRSKFAEGLGATLSQMYAGSTNLNSNHPQLNYHNHSSLSSSSTSTLNVTRHTTSSSRTATPPHPTPSPLTTGVTTIVKSPRPSPNSSLNLNKPQPQLPPRKRESPLDLSVKTVRVSADSSTNSLESLSTMGLNNGLPSRSSSVGSMIGAIVKDAMALSAANANANANSNGVGSNVVAAVANSTTADSPKSARKSTKDPNSRSRTSTPVQRQQSPSLSSSQAQRVANLNMSIPTPTTLVAPQNSVPQQQPHQQQQPPINNQNHHLLPSPSPYHPQAYQYQGSQPPPSAPQPQTSQNSAPPPQSRPPSVIPPYNPQLGAYAPPPPPAASPYHQMTAYSQHYPHYQQHAQHYYAHPPPQGYAPQQPQPQQPPQAAPKPGQQLPPTSTAPLSYQQQKPPPPSSPYGQPHPQPYYQHQVQLPYYQHQAAQRSQSQVQVISYNNHYNPQAPGGFNPYSVSIPNPQHISYPTYIPGAQRTVAAPTPQPQAQPGYPNQNQNSNSPANAQGQQQQQNYQPHPGLRPTTPTGPPPPLTPQQQAAQYQQYQQVQSAAAAPVISTNSSNSNSNAQMKPPSKAKAPPTGRNNVLNILARTVESRMQEKAQEKEKFQFNSHQTWNFHGRKFNSSLPPLNHAPAAPSVLNAALGGGASVNTTNLGSAGSSINSSNSSTPSFKELGGSKYDCGSGGGCSANAEDEAAAALQRIRTKAEKKQLFPNLLSQIEQENAKAKGQGQVSVFDFKDDDFNDPTPKINDINLKIPSVLPKSPPKRRNSTKKAKPESSNLYSSTTAAAKTVSKLAAEGSIDAFWAACDSFVDDLASNPNSIKSRRGGIWQKMKKEAPKPSATNANAEDGDGSKKPKKATNSSPRKVGPRLRKLSEEEDSDFKFEEEKSESEEEKEETGSLSTSNSISTARKKIKREASESDGDDDDAAPKKKRRRIQEDSDEEELTKKKSLKSKKSKAASSSDDDEDDESDNKRSPRRRRRTANKFKRSSQRISDMDEDATSRSSIGSEGSDSEFGLSDSSNSDEEDDDDDGSSATSRSSDSEHSARRRKGGAGGRKTKSGRRTRSSLKKSLKKNLRSRNVGKKSKSEEDNDSDDDDDQRSKVRRTTAKVNKRTNRKSESEDEDENFEPKSLIKGLGKSGKGKKRKLPKRNCAPLPGHGKLKDISGESELDDPPPNNNATGAIVDGGISSASEEWIMRDDLTKKKRKIVFGDGSDFKRPGWEEELIDFKRKLRMPQKLIQVSKPASLMSSSPANSVSGEKAAAKENKVPRPLATNKVTTPKKALTLGVKKTGSDSESLLDEPTIERTVERMRAAAAAATTKEKPSPVLSKASSLPAKKGNARGKNGSSLDELPVLSPQVPEPTTATAATNSTPPSTPVVKKGIRRNKFKSGFDYIRKKKKALPPSSAEVTPVPKKAKIIIEKNTSIEDVAAEIRSWVLNKGHGETALHRAARLGYPDVAAYALEHELVPPNTKDNAGYTPLHETCIKGNLEVAKVLLAYGADPSSSAPGGIRPLHEACENGHVELVRLLISYGADPTLTTYAGQSPLELAESHAPTRHLLDQHLNDVMGAQDAGWEFKGSGSWAENYHALGFEATADAPAEEDPGPEDGEDFGGFEFEASEIPLPPLYKLKEKPQFYVLLSDILNYLGLSRDRFLKQNPALESLELNSNDFLEEATCCHLLGERFNINSSSEALTLIKYDERIKKMLNIESLFIK